MKAFAGLGVIWQLKEPPSDVLDETRRPSRYQIERAETDLTEAYPLPHRSAQRACRLLTQAANESSEPLAARARAALAAVANSMSPYRHRAQEIWLQLVENAREHIWKVSTDKDSTASRAITILSEAAHNAMSPIRCRARETLSSLAHSFHPMSETAAQILASLNTAHNESPA